MAKQQLCTCITLFLYDHHVKMPFFTFCGGLERKNTTFFPFSGLRYQLQKKIVNGIWRIEGDGILSAIKFWSSPTSLLGWRFRSRRRRCCLIRWCYTRRFAMMIFSATQHCNIVATLFRIVTTLFQHCNAVFPWKSLLRIVRCNPWKLKKWAAYASLPWEVSLSLFAFTRDLIAFNTVLSSKLDTELRLHHSRTSMCDHLPLVKL